MNLQHERMLSLCETLNLPFIAQDYAIASQAAAEKEVAYSDFLEGLLRTEAAVDAIGLVGASGHPARPDRAGYLR
jgi:hypothetical protein